MTSSTTRPHAHELLPLIEFKGFEPAEGTCGCSGCAFKSMPLYDGKGRATNCQKVACFKGDFPMGHAMASVTRPIIWVRKEPA